MSSETATDSDHTGEASSATYDATEKEFLDARLPKVVWYPLYILVYLPVVFTFGLVLGAWFALYESSPVKAIVIGVLLGAGLVALVVDSWTLKGVGMAAMLLYFVYRWLKGDGGGGGDDGNRVSTYLKWRAWYSN